MHRESRVALGMAGLFIFIFIVLILFLSITTYDPLLIPSVKKEEANTDALRFLWETVSNSDIDIRFATILQAFVLLTALIGVGAQFRPKGGEE